MATYIAILRKDADSDYGVDFPDLPGCVAAGSTLEEAQRNAAQALEIHLRGMIEEGLEVPAPGALDNVLADPENVDGVPFLVQAADPEERAMRVNITLAPAVLGAIDAYAKAHRVTRSKLIADAAGAYIKRGAILRSTSGSRRARSGSREQRR